MDPEGSRPSDAPRLVGVGCLMTVAGLFSGGMIGVLVAKFVGIARRCVPEQGLPACDWHLYAFAGMIVGAVSLPLLALRRLRQPAPAGEHSERG
jgi:hypothetical protein